MPEASLKRPPPPHSLPPRPLSPPSRPEIGICNHRILETNTTQNVGNVDSLSFNNNNSNNNNNNHSIMVVHWKRTPRSSRSHEQLSARSTDSKSISSAEEGSDWLQWLISSDEGSPHPKTPGVTRQWHSPLDSTWISILIICALQDRVYY